MGQNPDAIYAKGLDVIQFADGPAKVAVAVAIAVFVSANV
jgi:hypothetical protein